MQSHNADAQTICGALNTSADSGLSQKEAQLRLDQHGPNKLAEKKRKPRLARFFDQFKDVMILILLFHSLWRLTGMIHPSFLNRSSLC